MKQHQQQEHRQQQKLQQVEWAVPRRPEEFEGTTRGCQTEKLPQWKSKSKQTGH